MNRSLGAARAVASERGFTLVEMMVAIGIAAILMAIAVHAWGVLKTKSRVKSTAEEIRSVLSAERLRALATHVDKTVLLDFTQNSVKLPAWGAARKYKGVDLVAYTFSTCTMQMGVTSNTITFKSTGTAAGTAGVSGNLAVLLRPSGLTVPTYYLVVNPVTGSVKMTETCP